MRRTTRDEDDYPPDENDYIADAPAEDTPTPARPGTTTVTTTAAGFLRALGSDSS
jgi:hypothetical protein